MLRIWSGVFVGVPVWTHLAVNLNTPVGPNCILHQFYSSTVCVCVSSASSLQAQRGNGHETVNSGEIQQIKLETHLIKMLRCKANA